jgi:hypothetical protein
LTPRQALIFSGMPSLPNSRLLPFPKTAKIAERVRKFDLMRMPICAIGNDSGDSKGLAPGVDRVFSTPPLFAN